MFFLYLFTHSSNAEIVIPEPKIIKIFSSLSQADKYKFNVGFNMYIGTANTSAGLQFNLYNNINTYIAPIIGFETKYHFYHTNNHLSQLNRIINAGINTKNIASHSITIIPKMDYLFRLGLKFKLNKDFSLSTYGIAGLNWSKSLIIDNKKQNNSVDRNQVYGTKIMSFKDFNQYVTDYIEKIGITSFQLPFFKFDKEYILYEEDGIFDNINLFNQESFLNNGDSVTHDESYGLIYSTIYNDNDIVFIKASNGDFNMHNQVIGYNTQTDDDGNLQRIFYTEKNNILIYQEKHCDADGVCTIKFINGGIQTENKNDINTNNTHRKNKFVGKYGAGIELMYKDKVNIKMEYIYTGFDISTITIPYKMNIHEITFGLGYYFL